MGFLTDGDGEDDELFDLFLLNEINKENNKGGNSSNSGGGCLTSFLLIIAIPVTLVVATVSALM